MTAVLLLVVAVTTTFVRDPATALQTVAAADEGWLTVWDTDSDVVREPGTCDVLTMCAGWIIGRDTETGVTFEPDRAVLDAGSVWQLVVSGQDGVTGAVLEAGASLPDLEPLPPPAVEPASRRLVVRWTAPADATTDVVACDRDDTCVTIVARRDGTTATVALASVARLVETGVTLRDVQVRVDAGDRWWWSARVALPAPIEGQG